MFKDRKLNKAIVRDDPVIVSWIDGQAFASGGDSGSIYYAVCGSIYYPIAIHTASMWQNRTPQVYELRFIHKIRFGCVWVLSL